jgi:hypothetical protein
MHCKLLPLDICSPSNTQRRFNPVDKKGLLSARIRDELCCWDVDRKMNVHRQLRWFVGPRYGARFITWRQLGFHQPSTDNSGYCWSCWAAWMSATKSLPHAFTWARTNKIVFDKIRVYYHRFCSLAINKIKNLITVPVVPGTPSTSLFMILQYRMLYSESHSVYIEYRLYMASLHLSRRASRVTPEPITAVSFGLIDEKVVMMLVALFVLYIFAFRWQRRNFGAVSIGFFRQWCSIVPQDDKMKRFAC